VDIIIFIMLVVTGVLSEVDPNRETAGAVR